MPVLGTGKAGNADRRNLSCQRLTAFVVVPLESKSAEPNPEMETEELLKGLLDRLIIGLREVEAWNEYVDALMRRDEIKEMDPEGLSDEQMAAMSFWRMNGVYNHKKKRWRIIPKVHRGEIKLLRLPRKTIKF